MPGEEVRAMPSAQMFGFDEFTGHTSLSERRSVWMAGRFEVKGGQVVTINNWSGHYRPNDSKPGYRAIENVAREALMRNGFPGAETARWKDPWGRR
jgi:hypothetical protein